MPAFAAVAHIAVASVVLGSAVVAPPAQQSNHPALPGTWRATLAGETYTVVVRRDSSASLGDQTVRWRLAGDTLLIALGETWYGYTFTLERERLSLAGGDLAEPLTLTRVGPPTPRPDSIPLPPAPRRLPGRSR